MRMELETVQAALAELERRQKKLIRQVQYAVGEVDRAKARAQGLRNELDGVQDQILALVVKERELKEQA